MADYLDSAVIGSTTSISRIDIVSFLASNTISTKSSISAAEFQTLFQSFDAATISGKTTTISIIESYGTSDADTISSTTSLEYVEVTTTDRLVVTETYTGLAVGDQIDFIVSVTTTTTTSTGGTVISPPPPPPEVIIGVSITTADYNNQPWIVAYNYDSGADVTAGTEGSFDGDDGLILVADAV